MGDMFSEVTALTELIQTASLQPEVWGEVARTVRSTFKGHSVNLLAVDESGVGVLHVEGASVGNVDPYRQHYVHIDEMMHKLSTVAPGSAYFTQDFFKGKRLINTPIYRDFYSSLGFAYFAAARLGNVKGGMAFLSVARAIDEKPFNSSDRQKMAFLAPQLNNAIRISLILSVPSLQRGEENEAFHRAHQPYLVIDRGGKVVYLNERAHWLLDNRIIRISGGQFSFVDRTTQAEAMSTIAARRTSKTSSVQSKMIRIGRHSPRMAAILHPLIPRSHPDFFSHFVGDYWGMLFLVEQPGRQARTEWLQRMFDLSSAESRVVAALANGLSVIGISKNLLLSENTVRTHLKHAFYKTQTGSQAELVSKVLGTLPEFGDELHVP